MVDRRLCPAGAPSSRRRAGRRRHSSVNMGVSDRSRKDSSFWNAAESRVPAGFFQQKSVGIRGTISLSRAAVSFAFGALAGGTVPWAVVRLVSLGVNAVPVGRSTIRTWIRVREALRHRIRGGANSLVSRMPGKGERGALDGQAGRATGVASAGRHHRRAARTMASRLVSLLAHMYDRHGSQSLQPIVALRGRAPQAAAALRDSRRAGALEDEPEEVPSPTTRHPGSDSAALVCGPRPSWRVPFPFGPDSRLVHTSKEVP